MSPPRFEQNAQYVRLLEQRQDFLERTLRTLAGWDMLTLTSDGKGFVTADAPWARGIIADALDAHIDCSGSPDA